MHILTFLPLLALATARDIDMVTNTNSTIYAESKTGQDTIGYYFALDQNVLSVMVNGTLNNGDVEPAAVMIIPNLLLEYNKTIGPNDTTSVFGFLDKPSGMIGDWGKGLTAKKFTSKLLNQTDEDVDVWQIQAEWKNPEDKKGRPKFNAVMLFSSGPTNFQGHRLAPNLIDVRYSILNYPFSMKDSVLALNQIVLSQGGIHELFNDTDVGEGDLGSLRVNRTALVDGKKERLDVAQYNNTNVEIDIVVGNSTSVNVTSFEKESLLFTFRNSNNAKNVTMDQRIALNITNLRMANATAENSACVSGVSSFLLTVGTLVSALLVALPALVF